MFSIRLLKSKYTNRNMVSYVMEDLIESNQNVNQWVKTHSRMGGGGEGKQCLIAAPLFSSFHILLFDYFHSWKADCYLRICWSLASDYTDHDHPCDMTANEDYVKPCKLDLLTLECPRCCHGTKSTHDALRRLTNWTWDNMGNQISSSAILSTC